jgi:murein L,D-transpeptidase YcbB/YkuD
MSKRLCYMVILLFCWSCVVALTPPASAFETIPWHLHHRLQHDSRLSMMRVAGERLRASHTVKLFYEQRAYRPAWSRVAGPSSLAHTLIESLSVLEPEGLDPHDYHLRALAGLIATVHQWPMTSVVGKLVDLELLLSDAFLSAALDLTTGRLQPVGNGSTPHALDAEMAGHLEHALMKHTLTSTLQGLAPSDSTYTKLRQALAQYRQIAANGGWHTISQGPALTLGAYNDRVAMLRARLRVTGDLAPAMTPKVTDPNRFDATLEQAVNRFQQRHGLTVDGLVGPRTLAALNVPAEARVRQIILNMERLRHPASRSGDRRIVVNIPNYQLNVMEKGQSVLNMRVVVGKPDWQTPTFQSTMTHLVVNPYWVVPEGITQREIIPKMLQDPAYLENQNMEMLRGYGSDMQIINPASVDWSTLSTRDFPYRFRQRPGSRNALGRIKFKFPNRFHVYMHDTPARALFAKTRRAFSHGCVRLERPADLAAYLLRADPAWTLKRIEQAIKGGQRQYISLQRPIAVHFIYQTAWVDADGRVQFRPDIYGLDKRHQNLLCRVAYYQCA